MVLPVKLPWLDGQVLSRDLVYLAEVVEIY